MPLQFLDLPPESLMTIVDYFGPSQADFVNFDHEFEPDVSLYRLAQTCTTLRDICLPKYYEICTIQVWGNLNRSLSIIRTLNTRPEIANRVKRIILDAEFSVKGYGILDIEISTEEAASFNNILRKGLDMTTAAPLSKVVGLDCLSWHRCRTVGESLACVALALVPNITSAILVPATWTYYGCSNHIPLGPFKAAYFPLLEAFSIQNPVKKTPTTWENAMGVLPQAVPNVRRLIGWGINQLPQTTYPYVKQLVLGHSLLSDKDLVRLPMVFPNLERFTWVGGTSCSREIGELCLPVVFERMLGLRKTLSHLEIGSHSLEYREPFDRFHPYQEPFDTFPISQMKLLENLRLPADLIWVPVSPRQALNGFEQETTLVHSLPTSIRNLYVESVESSHEPGILALAQAAPHRFPNLSQVTFAPLRVPLEQSFQDIVRCSYEVQGIKCSFEDVDVNVYGVHYRLNDGSSEGGER